MAEVRPVRLTVTHIGPSAARTLAGVQTSPGQVVAVFRHAAYLQFRSGMVCLAGSRAALGPLAVITAGAGAFPDLIETGQPVWRRGTRFTVGPRVVIDPVRAEPWSPAPWPPLPAPGRIREALACLRRHVPSTVPATGLGPYVMGGSQPAPTGRVARHARHTMAAARMDLVCREEAGLHWARDLLGLGPGLTPSGDDCLGGMLLALHAIGERPVARRLWGRIKTDVCTRTHAISRAHLAAAAHGLGSERVHRILRILLEGAHPASALADLARMGQSSGWDTLAGVVTVLEGYGHMTRQQVT